MTKAKTGKSAWVLLLEQLSRRSLTGYELETRLRARNYPSQEVQAALEKAEQLGYLDDRELALAFAQSRLKRYSRCRVRQDLQRRGIDGQIVEEVLAAVYSEEEEFQQCLALAERWWLLAGQRKEMSDDNGKNEIGNRRYIEQAEISGEFVQQQKVAGKLRQRGYSCEMVRKALREIQNR